MGDLLRDASDWLEKVRHQHLTTLVTYQRGAKSVDVPATVEETAFFVDKGFGVQERVESRDYLLLASALVLDGVAVEPQAGDEIIEAGGGVAFTFEVMSPGGKPCWRWSDLNRRTLRIHTKLVLTATEGA